MSPIQDCGSLENHMQQKQIRTGNLRLGNFFSLPLHTFANIPAGLY